MEPDKNLHATIPNALLAEAQRVAEAEHMSVDEFVRDAMERRLREIRRDKLYAYGEERARRLGVQENDVESIVHQYRKQIQRER